MRNKSVFHIRIDSPGYKSDAIEKAFIENGYEYNMIKWQLARYENGLESMREQVLSIAEEIRPTLIFAHIQNSEAFDLEAWVKLSKCGFVINYTFDVRSNEEMRWMYEVAPNIGHTLFACQEDVLNCREKQIWNTSLLQSSCNMELYRPKRGQMNYAFDIVFCGNRYDNTNLKFPLAAERQEMISVLEQKYGARFMSYGLGQKGGLIKPEVEASVYTFSKIAICQNNFFLTGYTSDRIWRVMASGAMCLTKYFPGIENIFERGKHLDWFNTYEEMIEKIDYYLSDDKERLAIAEVGMNYVRENHTWNNRVQEIEKIIGELK